MNLRLQVRVILLFGVMFVAMTGSSQQANSDWVQIGTLSGAPGSIQLISPDSRYVVISDGDVSRLVEIETGAIVEEMANAQAQFSPSGRYFILSTYDNGLVHSHILDLDTRLELVVSGSVREFIDSEQFAHVDEGAYDGNSGTDRLIELSTGKTIVEYPGNAAFSSDARFVAVTDVKGRNNISTKIIEIGNETVLATYRYDYSSTSGVWGTWTGFQGGGQYWWVYYFPEAMRVYDTTTWLLIYEVTSPLLFSQDGRYVATTNDDGYSEVQLMEAATGRILDKVVGTYYFSSDGRYLFRHESITHDVFRAQVIDLTTFEIVFEVEGYISAPRFVDEGILEVVNWHPKLDTTTYYDLNSREIVYQVSGSAQRTHNLLVAREYDHAIDVLYEWGTTVPLVRARQIEVTPNGRYALVSNGMAIHVFGQANTQPDTMPPPQPLEGIARAEIGEILVYSAPSISEPCIVAEQYGNLLNPTYMIVQGQAEEGDWLYVTFISRRTNSNWTQQIVTGWIERDTVLEIATWDAVPIYTRDQALPSVDMPCPSES